MNIAKCTELGLKIIQWEKRLIEEQDPLIKRSIAKTIEVLQKDLLKAEKEIPREKFDGLPF